MENTIEGVVVRKSSRDVRVDTVEGMLLCTVRGHFRGAQDGRLPVVAGDRVLVSKLGPGEGVLEEVLSRRTELLRGTAGGRPLVVAANVDQLLVVLSAREPEPRWALADRMLVAAERDGIVPAICLNKEDQVSGPGEEKSQEKAALEEALLIYHRLGYATFFTSAVECKGFDALCEWLRGKVTVFSGHSGVGKSTLLNALCPGFCLEMGHVNPVTGKGRHTTTSVFLFPAPFGGFVADTPGFREFLPVDLKPAELGKHYPEFRSIQQSSPCRFSDCLHRTEPRCPIRAAVDSGIVSKMRYQNYLQILSTLERPESGRRG